MERGSSISSLHPLKFLELRAFLLNEVGVHFHLTGTEIPCALLIITCGAILLVLQEEEAKAEVMEGEWDRFVHCFDNECLLKTIHETEVGSGSLDSSEYGSGRDGFRATDHEFVARMRCM